MIAIIDSGISNVRSVANMLKKGGVADVEVTRDTARITLAHKIILPGVGAFDAGMRALRDLDLHDILTQRVTQQGIPVLGICLGMQLMGTDSEEGTEPGLGWIDGTSARFRFAPDRSGRKIPHMGWNVAIPARTSSLFEGMDPDARFYFVHSYHLQCHDPVDVLATSTYGYPFTAAVQRGNVYGVQFHPEKSHRFGMALLQRFAAL